MARPLFEQYKDALRRGHLALLGDELEAAVAAYREAASLVPDRPLPYASLGGALTRLGRIDEALEAYDQALAFGPDDPAVADARADLVARRAAGEVPVPATGRDEPTARPDESAPETELAPESAPAPGAAPASGVARSSPSRLPAATTSAAAAWPAIDLPSLPPPAPVGPPPDPAVLQAEADGLLDGGDVVAAHDLLLTAVAAHRQAGRLDAALDACLQLLAIGPGDPRVHLAIANLQLDRGWRDVATEKIELLLRLTSLSGDAQSEADVHLLAAERLRDESPTRLDARRKGLPAA